MGYAVGVDFGSVLSTAGIVKWDNDFPDRPESFRSTGPIPSVAYVSSDNELIVGKSAHHRGEADPQRVIRDFKRRLGDPVPIMVGDWYGQTENVVAAVIRQIVDNVGLAEGAAPDVVAVTHPASWGAYKQELLLGALTDAGLADVVLVSEPQAAVTNTDRNGSSAIRTMVVYDLGGGSFEASVLTGSVEHGFTLLGHSQGLDWLGGSDFDQAIFSRVQSAAGLKNLDPGDHAVVAALGRLRRDCTAAKELLSIDTEATITVVVAGRRTRIRLVRSEFEELIRDSIDDTVDTTRRAIRSAGLAETDIDAIVLVGGSSRIPLVAQVLSAEFSLPIIVDATPEASTSLGAARLARGTLQAPSPAVEPGSAPGATPTEEANTQDLRSDDSPTESQSGVSPSGVSPSGTAPSGTHSGPEPAHRNVAVPGGSAPDVADDTPTAGMAPDVADDTPTAGMAPDVADDTLTAGAAPAPPQPATPATEPAPLPAVPSAQVPPPSQVPGPSVGPAGRPDRLNRRGRHRRRGIRRYWMHVVGIIAAVAAIISAGSALATSQASDRNSPVVGPQANGVVTGSTTATVVASTIAATRIPAAQEAPDGTTTTTSPDPSSVGSGSTAIALPWLVPDVAPNEVGAPAVIMNLSELVPPGQPADGQSADPTATGASSAHR